MIHVATVHHQSDKWIDVQLSYLRRHLPEPYAVHANLEGVASVHHEKFTRVVPGLGRHDAKLNLLAASICGEADDDDVLMFLDGDAFPIADPMPLLGQWFQRSPLAAVRRSENLGDPQPHPLFCATTVGFWKELRGDWAPGYPWVNEAGATVTDVGGNLLFLLERAGVPWTPILRSNRRNLHPVFFGVYGDLVYHHGAGFRDVRTTRRDRHDIPGPRESVVVAGIPGVERFARKIRSWRVQGWLRQIADRTVAVNDRLYEQARYDPLFYRQLL